jgi:hypothetical protein
MKNSAVTSVAGMIQRQRQAEARPGVAEQHQRAEEKRQDAARRQHAVRRRKNVGDEQRDRQPDQHQSGGHRHGLAHGHGFVDGLLKFAFGRGIVHPAAAGLHVSLAVLEQRGADGDAGVEIAVEGKIADAAAVGPRVVCSSSEMICIARIFGAPLTVPAGNVARINRKAFCRRTISPPPATRCA